MDTDQIENEKNISSLVTRIFCFSSYLTFGAFSFGLRNLPWSDAVRVKEPSDYKCI